MKTLILTEKPSVAMDFARALGISGKKQDGYIEGQGYIITWAVGHLVELFEPEDYDPKWKKWNINTLPLIPDQFRYKPIPRTKEQLNIIKRLLKRRLDEVVIATDAGREGEVIARTILQYSGFSDTSRLKRFWTSQALIPKVVKDGMNFLQPASKFDRLWKAGRCRQIGDWTVGMSISRAATLKMNDLFSVGRVQTAVLALLVDRRKERENFKPEPYWVLKCHFFNHKGDWWGSWFKKNLIKFDKEEDAKKIESKIFQQQGFVKSVKIEKKRQPPPFLFSLTDLQRDANSKFGFSAKNTLNIAQRLYEQKKCLSYPRTDSKVLGSKNVNMTKDLVNRLSQVYSKVFSGVNSNLISARNKRVFNDAKLTDHHALIPLKPVPENADHDEKMIYYLVLNRFAAVFHPDCEYEQTEIITEVIKETFRTKGKRILTPGWKMVYDFPDKKKNDKQEEPENLPPLVKGDPAAAQETRLEKKMTKPPPEYNEALLLKDMTNPGKYVSEDDLKKIYRGEVGLGTQSTRAQIIETLIARKYILRQQKRNIIATDKGCHLIMTLRQFTVAKNLTSPEETARWEQKLHLIARGDGSDEAFLDEIMNFVRKSVEEFKAGDVGVSKEIDLGFCPSCRGKMIEGKRGFGCSNWRKEDGGCRFVVWKNISGRVITPLIASQLIAKKEAGPYDGFISDENKKFSGILYLINENGIWQVMLKNAGRMKKPESSDTIGECPACGGSVIEGKKGYGCSNWRSQDGGCKFVIWKTIAKKKISKKIAVRLLEKGFTGKIDGFKSKKGKKFSVNLKLVKDESGLFKVEFDFGN